VRNGVIGSPTLHIRLFGALDLRLGDAPLALESARAESLLAFLLLQRDAPQSRRAIAFQLWPDSTEAQALTNLRHVLHTLRHVLPAADHYIEAAPRTLQWRASAPYRLDVEAFSTALTRADQHAGDEFDRLREAVELYAGDLLEGSYDEWLLARREEFQRRYLDALERLTRLHAERGEHAAALLLAERLLRHDPLDERTWRLLMHLHAAHGDQARALRAYHACASTLERELGVETSPETRLEYEALLAPNPAQHAAVEPDHGAAVRLPLVGRAEEWARLVDLWHTADAGRARCLLVAGEAGSGKTRLVEELRDWCVQRGALAAEGRSYAAEGALAYGPVVAWLRAESIGAHHERLGPAARTELARLLPEMLVADPALPPPRPLPEDDQRQRLYDALVQGLLAAGQPLLLIADDLHWCDRETLGFLHYLLRVAPDARLLVAATARGEELDSRPLLREFLNGLRAIECLDTLELGPLRRAEALVLAERIAGRGLSRPEADHLYATTEGNALFVIEAVRAGWQADATGRTPLTPRVQAAIESRLGQVSAEARDLAGVAATIGGQRALHRGEQIEQLLRVEFVN
jgi:DNA-binding SARP family transcriptional activator